MKQSFYFYDYETGGFDHRQHYPLQFAGVRTDMDFNIIEDPLELYCKPHPDYVPSFPACRITGITPQVAEEKGMFEYQFAAKIHQVFSQPGTCVLGYNSLNFDDEFTRHLFYRNFYDPYEREWKDGNCRWDLLQLIRTCYALRPNVLNWPVLDDDKVSIKLEKLTKENNIEHNAHSALSDVMATIALAKIIKSKEPRLVQYLLKNKDKATVKETLNLPKKDMVLHISGKFAANNQFASIVTPILINPTSINKVVCYDLRVDPTPFMHLSAEELYERVYTKKEELQKERFPIKDIHINRAPVVLGMHCLDQESAVRLNLDKEQCAENNRKLREISDLEHKICQIVSMKQFAAASDVEERLYDGFLANPDKWLMSKIRSLDGMSLANTQFNFQDDRLPELLFRYRARNFNETLNQDEQRLYHHFCRNKIINFEKNLEEEKITDLSDQDMKIYAQLVSYTAEKLKKCQVVV